MWPNECSTKMSAPPRTSILFVCMGNICRSPLAEGVFLHKLQQRGVVNRFLVDSAGTGQWHAGERPDRRARAIAKQHGIVLTSRARQVTTEDFDRFDHLICMDEANREQLENWGAPQHKLQLLLEVDPDCELQEVPDPFYGGGDGFQTIFRLIDSACDALLDQLLATTQ